MRKKKTPSVRARAQFAEMIHQRLKQAGETREITYDAGDFSLRVGAGMLNLNNIYRQYLAAPKTGRERIVRGAVRGCLAERKKVPTDFSDARPDLYPKFETRASLALQELRGEAVPPHRVVGEHLALTVAFDWPEASVWVTAEMLAQWGATFPEALAAAKQNLRDHTRGYAEVAEGVYTTVEGDFYDASRFLLTDWIGQLPLPGEPVAVVPDRDCFLVTGSENTNGLAWAVEHSHKLINRPYYLSPFFFRLEQGQWRPWRPPVDHPQYAAIREMEIPFWAAIYASQDDWLQASHDEFVARLTPYGGRGTFPSFGLTSWAPGMSSILPRADFIGFVDPPVKDMATWTTSPGEVAVVRWDDAVRLLGRLMRPLGGYPERWRVEDWAPTIEFGELKELEPDVFRHGE